MKKILDAFKEMNQQIKSVQSNVSDIIDIANFSSNSKEVTNLLIAECSEIKAKLGYYDTSALMVAELFQKIEFQKLPNDDESDKDQSPKDEKKMIEESLNLRPQKEMKRIFKEETIRSLPVVEIQQQMMRELHELSNTDYRYIYFGGIYPRINYLQDTPPEEVRYWFNFGAINSIYLSSPEFPEISLLPHWILQGVKDCYMNNPTISPKDILVLKFLSAGPDFYEEERYNAYHFIQLGKAEAFSVGTSKQPNKKFRKFDENDIHYRRSIGMNIVLKGLETAFKKGFRTYGGKKSYSSIMISPAKHTPPAAEKYLQYKISLIEKGLIKSSPQAQAKICQFRKHDKGICPNCSKMKSKVTEIITSSSDDE